MGFTRFTLSITNTYEKLSKKWPQKGWSTFERESKTERNLPTNLLAKFNAQIVSPTIYPSSIITIPKMFSFFPVLTDVCVSSHYVWTLLLNQASVLRHPFHVDNGFAYIISDPRQVMRDHRSAHQGCAHSTVDRGYYEQLQLNLLWVLVFSWMNKSSGHIHTYDFMNYCVNWIVQEWVLYPFLWFQFME